MTIKEYIDNMYNALIGNPYMREYYEGKDGHKRLARNFGFGCADFSDGEFKSELGNTYGYIYVRWCNLKPLLDTKEWFDYVIEGRDFYLQDKYEGRGMFNENLTRAIGKHSDGCMWLRMKSKVWIL